MRTENERALKQARKLYQKHGSWKEVRRAVREEQRRQELAVKAVKMLKEAKHDD